MWIKILGAAGIVGASCLYGMKISDGLRLRRDSLNNIADALVLLESEITFSVNSIDGAFKNISKSIPLSGFFEKVSEETHIKGIRMAWNDAIGEYKSRLGLTDGDAKILVSLSAELGITDRENQIKNIKYVLSRLSAAQKEAAEKYATLSRLYRNICIWTGLAAAILLI